MKKIQLTIFCCLLSILLSSQTIKVQGGISVSKIDWKIGGNSFDYMDENLIGHALYLGIDYYQKKYFGISSNIGIIRKGEKETLTLTGIQPNDPAIPDEEITYKTFLDYISINTLLEFHYPIKEKLHPFVNIGPRIDFMYKYEDENHFQSENRITKISYGLDLGLGIRLCVKNYKIGIRYAQLLNFNNLHEGYVSFLNQKEVIKDKTKLISISLGYTLNKI